MRIRSSEPPVRTANTEVTIFALEVTNKIFVTSFFAFVNFVFAVRGCAKMEVG